MTAPQRARLLQIVPRLRGEWSEQAEAAHRCCRSRTTPEPRLKGDGSPECLGFCLQNFRTVTQTSQSECRHNLTRQLQTFLPDCLALPFSFQVWALSSGSLVPEPRRASSGICPNWAFDGHFSSRTDGRSEGVLEPGSTHTEGSGASQSRPAVTSRGKCASPLETRACAISCS